MKFIVMLFTLLAGLIPATVFAQAATMRLAVTTSFNNSGLSDVLLPEIRRDLDLEVQLLVVGTGQALRLGAAGDVDAVLVHAKAVEETFIAEGHAEYRREIMYNDFVLIGPKSDPANARQVSTIIEALNAIAASQQSFISRGDDSGTHRRELSLWGGAGLTPGGFGGWYRSVGAGMGATLNVASAMNAYTLSDRASWLKFGNKGDLALLFAGDPTLFNQYAYMPVSRKTHPRVDEVAAKRLEVWLTGDRAKALINGYVLNGEQLFTHNAKP